MSGAMRIAKAQYRGDPGIFGSIGKFIGGAVKGGIGGLLTGNPVAALAGAAAGGIKAVAGNGKPLNPSVNVTARALPSTAVNILTAGNVPLFPAPQRPDSVVTRQGGSVPGLWHGGMTTTQYFPSAGGAAHPGGGCGAGYHANKTGYYTSGGYVPAGSKCVRNRKRNPLNPRAASRAMSRLSSAKKAAKFLGAVSIREKGCGCK